MLALNQSVNANEVIPSSSYVQNTNLYDSQTKYSKDLMRQAYENARKRQINFIKSCGLAAIRGDLNQCLTKDSTPVNNGNGLWDNKSHEMIICVGDILQAAAGTRKYQIVSPLGKGTFGQVFKAKELHNNDRMVAIKIIKSDINYTCTAITEISILCKLNRFYETNNTSSIVKLEAYFKCQNHLCLVFPVLGMHFHNLILTTKRQGFSLKYIRTCTRQILHALKLLYLFNYIHTDLKPENILLDLQNYNKIYVIDVGSACKDDISRTKKGRFYIQSRFYRAPEVILGSTFDKSIDIWSLGCIVAELVLGYPLFPAKNQYLLLYRIEKLLGKIPQNILKKGNNTIKFYNYKTYDKNECVYELKSIENYFKENNLKTIQIKNYVKGNTIKEMICHKFKIINDDVLKLIDFISACLSLDPCKRPTPFQLFDHPFFNSKMKYNGKYIPKPQSYYNEQLKYGYSDNYKMKMNHYQMNQNKYYY